MVLDPSRGYYEFSQPKYGLDELGRCKNCSIEGPCDFHLKEKDEQEEDSEQEEEEESNVISISPYIEFRFCKHTEPCACQEYKIIGKGYFWGV